MNYRLFCHLLSSWVIANIINFRQNTGNEKKRWALLEMEMQLSSIFLFLPTHSLSLRDYNHFMYSFW